MNNVTKKSTIGLIIAKNIKTAQIFNEYNINIGAENMYNIEDICDKHNIIITELLTKLSKLPPPLKDEQPDFLNMPLDELSRYIMLTHHKFLYNNIKKMEEFLVAATNEQQHEFPALKEALNAFNDFEKIMYHHLKLEENEYFPFICKMVKIADKELPFQKNYSHTAIEFIEILTKEHRNASKLVNKVCRLVRYQNPPRDAGENYLNFIDLARELYKDIHIRISLEDSILQPKSIILEQQLNALQKYVKED